MVFNIQDYNLVQKALTWAHSLHWVEAACECTTSTLVDVPSWHGCLHGEKRQNFLQDSRPDDPYIATADRAQCSLAPSSKIWILMNRWQKNWFLSWMWRRISSGVATCSHFWTCKNLSSDSHNGLKSFLMLLMKRSITNCCKMLVWSLLKHVLALKESLYSVMQTVAHSCIHSRYHLIYRKSLFALPLPTSFSRLVDRAFAGNINIRQHK